VVEICIEPACTGTLAAAGASESAFENCMVIGTVLS
jgi:hypothetical protein